MPPKKIRKMLLKKKLSQKLKKTPLIKVEKIKMEK